MKKFTPRPYQKIAIRHLIKHPKCALFVFMGAGKSASVLSALDKLSLTEDDVFPALILAPLRVARSVWPEEISKWSCFNHLTISVVTGTPNERMAALRKKADIYCTNYEQIPWLTQHLQGKWPFKTIVADELTRIKSFRSRQGGSRARALAQMVQLHCKRFIGLTGTPTPNGLKDLWGMLYFLDSGQRLGRTYTAFMQRWFQKGWDGYSLQALPHAQKEIQSRISDICLSIDPKDYFDFKEPIETNIYVDLPDKAKRLYKEMETKMFVEIEQCPIEAFNAASRTNKLSQLANGAIYHDEEKNFKEVHDEKIEALRDIIEEANGAPVLVAYYFKSDLVRLGRHFNHGRMLDKNPKTIKEWNEGKISLLFAHPASAGHGINLAKGSNIIAFFGMTWDMEQYSQICERIGPVRQLQEGLDRNVFIYHILARNTIDEDMLERLKTKQSVQQVLLNAMKRRSA